MSVTTDARAVLLGRIQRYACRRGSFRLASGRESDFFVDCKRVVLTAEGHRLVGEVLCDAIEASGWPAVTAVAGVALGGCPLASAVSLTSALRGHPLDALYVRPQPKDHGTAARVEGTVPRGASVILLEDVLTTGGSSLAGIAALGTEGYPVVGVIALVDRSEGAMDTLGAAGVRVQAMYNREDLTR